MPLKGGSDLSSPAESAKRAVLPFALISSGTATEEFPIEMTYATILADVEKHRAKAGLIRKQEEIMSFVSTIHWPIITVPWREGRHLVFDGMAVWSYVFEDRRVASTEAFVKALSACKNFREFIALEASHAGYFRDFAVVERLPVMGLFIHEEFMKDLLEHINLAQPREGAHSSFLEPRLPGSEAANAVKKIADMILFGRKMLAGLEQAKEILKIAVDRFRKEIDGVIDETKRKYNAKIDAIKPEVTTKVADLEKRRDEAWSSMQPRLVSLQGEVRRLESEESHWHAESKRKDATPDVTAKAKERLHATRRDVQKAKDDAEKYQEEMSRMRGDYDKQIQSQWERIRSLERERDAQVNALINDQANMTQKASQMHHNMEDLKNRKEEEIVSVEAQGVPIPPHLSSEIVYMPLMVCLLQGDKGVRYLVYPPMIAKSGKGVLGGIQSMFGGLVLPLEPKTKEFDETFRAGIEKALAEDRSLATYIGSVSMSSNILHMRDLPEMLAKGLAEMKNQGWIKDKHEKELLASLQKHIALASSTAPRK